jgi:hypothetical protein
LTLGADANVEYTGEFVPTLADGSAPRGSGVDIPGITTGYTGGAPDRGAIITGRGIPAWGDSTPSDELPAWRVGQEIGEWRQISGTAPSTCPISVQTYPTLGATGPQAKIIAYGGMALDRSTSRLYMHGGGHNDYAGNEIDMLDLSADSPTWVEVQPSSPVSAIGSNQAYYSDGRPAAAHVYGGAHFIVQRNRWMRFGNLCWGNGNVSFDTVDGWNPTTQQWDPAGTYPDAPSFMGPVEHVFCQDHSTGNVYAAQNYNVSRWNQATNTWTSLISNASGRDMRAGSMAFDHTRGRMLCLAGAENSNHFFNTSNNTYTASGMTGSIPTNMSKCSTEYIEAIDSYFCKNYQSGGRYWLINAGTMVSTEFNPSSGSGIALAIVDNENWNRALYVPALGGIVYTPNYTSSVWFLRLH